MLEPVVLSRVDGRVAGGPAEGIVELRGLAAEGLVDGEAAQPLLRDRLEFPRLDGLFGKVAPAGVGEVAAHVLDAKRLEGRRPRWGDPGDPVARLARPVLIAVGDQERRPGGKAPAPVIGSLTKDWKARTSTARSELNVLENTTSRALSSIAAVNIETHMPVDPSDTVCDFRPALVPGPK